MKRLQGSLYRGFDWWNALVKNDFTGKVGEVIDRECWWQEVSVCMREAICLCMKP
ncbi:MAG: hypothetical protein ACLU8Z_04535 [Dorea sp.]